MVAAAVAAVAVVGGAYSANQSSKAAAGATGATERGAIKGTSAIENYTGQALNKVSIGENAAVGNLKPYAALGEGAVDQLKSLLGIGGDSASVLKSLQNTPGYQFTQQQGDQATINAATSSGMNLSGNTLEALSKYNSGLAEQTYQGAVTNAEAAAGMGMSAASNIAGIQTGSADTQAQLLSNAGTGIANVNIGQGTNEANINMAQAASNSAAVSNAGNDVLLASLMKSGSTDGYDEDFYKRHVPCRN